MLKEFKRTMHIKLNNEEILIEKNNEGTCKKWA